VRVTVAIPCYNEAATIAKVVRDFRAQLPDAAILVIDNDSSDATAGEAQEAGARVLREKRRGKGYAMQAILETVESDLCVVVDGDDTYFAEDVHALLEPLLADRADMVVGDRLGQASSQALSDLHRFGNRVILRIINLVFRTSFKDVLSGYRAVNRGFVRSVPLIAGGFETETELTLQALEKGLVIQEIPVRYRARPQGSLSKLSPWSDGYRILITMAVLLRNHRPLYFFSLMAAGLLGFDLVCLLAWTFVGRWPVPAVVVAAAAATAVGLVLLGVVLNAVTAGFREMAALARRPR
jgi:glycosyltransferase involved in cell wall biosynthesis